MASRKPPSLNLEDLASVIDGAFGEVSDEGTTRLAAMVSEDPGFAEQFTELRAMAQDAGCDLLGDGLQAHEELAQLLVADAWEHPVEVLGGDPDEIATPD